VKCSTYIVWASEGDDWAWVKPPDQIIESFRYVFVEIDLIILALGETVTETSSEVWALRDEQLLVDRIDFALLANVNGDNGRSSETGFSVSERQ
jgi:hypothetical protein